MFGGAPGSSVSGVPGPRVGYMPQELALYNEFTIAETLTYFGRVFNLTMDKIRKRTKFLVEFLDLPSESRMVSLLYWSGLCTQRDKNFVFRLATCLVGSKGGPHWLRRCSTSLNC